MKGSGLFSGYAALKPHLLQGPGGLAAEIEKVASALAMSLAGMAFIAIEEWDAPVAANATAIMPSTATVDGTVTYTQGVPPVASATAGFIFNPTSLATAARNVTITGGGTTGQCPTSAVVTGVDAGGNSQTETITLTAGSGTGVKGWSKVTSFRFLGGTGTAGTEEIGFGIVIGLSYAPKARTGQTVTGFTPVFPELEDGAVITSNLGTIDATNHAFTPHDAPNGTHTYALYYEAIGS